MASHGARRAVEMEEVADTLRELGVEPLMTGATVALEIGTIARKSAAADLRWLASRAPQGDGNESASRRQGERVMISPRQIEFRQEYRSRIIGWYDGYFHVAIIYAMGAAAFYVYVQHIHDVKPLAWLTIPLTFLFTNLFEWAVDKYVMHRPANIKGLRAVYERP